jgi:hypothetical protein
VVNLNHTIEDKSGAFAGLTLDADVAPDTVGDHNPKAHAFGYAT